MINISSLNALVATPVNDLMGALGFILSVSLFVVIALLIARFRSFLAAIWFIPAFSQLTYFVIFRFYEVTNFFTSGNTFLNGVLFGFEAINIPVAALHDINVKLLGLISKNEIYVKVITNDIFAFAIYMFFFVINFALFHKRKPKENKKFYDDF